MDKVRLAIIVSEFNYDITYLMLQKAIEHAKLFDADIKIVLKVPGTLEIPLALENILARSDIDAAIVLGAVVQGATKHDEVVAHQAIRKILDISVSRNKPVGIGIIGPGATRAQAQERIEDYARRATEAAIKMAMRIKKLKELKDGGEVKEVWLG